MVTGNTATKPFQCKNLAVLVFLAVFLGIVQISLAAELFESPTWSQEGGQTNAEFGYSVSTAGDVNGDGFSDIIVAAPTYDNG